MIDKSKNFFTHIKMIWILRWSLLTMAVFVFVLILVLIGNATINNKYQDVFLKGTKVSSIEIGNLNFEEAKAKIDKQVDFINRRGFIYDGDDKSVTIYPNIAAIESADTSYQLIYWEVDMTLDGISKAQSNNYLKALFNKIKTLLSGSDFQLEYSWDKQQHQDILESNFSDVLTDKQEASFKFVNNDIEIIPEQVGHTFDYKQAMQDTEQQIQSLVNKAIDLEVINDQPIITVATINSMKDIILNIAQRGDINLIFEDKDWNVSNDIWRQWLQVKRGINGIYVGIEQGLFELYLSEIGIKDAIEIEMQDAKFKLINNKVAEFINSQDGRDINLENTIYTFERVINQSGELEIELATDIIQAKTKNQDVNDLGIVEIIGTGESDFSGSPVNRIHNIRVGGDTLNGLLISPGEEFSLMGALGEIDGESGYRQELVIKGNETIPEYGGGLCQIGTTMFRAALDTGLPIVERRNHSYRVPYYEPAGTDATIYSPWPDFKFLNDTGHHILIQTRIEGSKIYFDFWGTSDDRVASITPPVIYNIVAPPAKKIIKTTDIPVGQEKCTERAHNGADAKFDYTVQYSGEEGPREETFYSHYIPWQEVCLIGVTEEELLAEQASSTPEDL